MEMAQALALETDLAVARFGFRSGVGSWSERGCVVVVLPATRLITALDVVLFGAQPVAPLLLVWNNGCWACSSGQLGGSLDRSQHRATFPAHVQTKPL